MTHTTANQPPRLDNPDHSRRAATVAGGPLDSEGPGSEHRYRNLVLGAVAILLLAMAMLVSYSSAFGHPQPNNVHLAVSGDAQTIVALEQQDQLDLMVVSSEEDAKTDVLDREVDGAIIVPTPGAGAPVTTYIASGSGKSLGVAISAIGETVAQKIGATNTTTDLAPLPENNPGGSIEFYAILFAGLGAALGATIFGRILGTVDTAPRFVERSIVLIAYSGLLAGLITLWINTALNAVTATPWAIFASLWLTVLAVGGAVTGVAAVGGTIAALATTLALVILGNTSSGGPFGIHLLNDFFQGLYYVFPQGDGLDLLRSIEYFDGAAIAGPVIRLAIWAAAGLLLALIAMLVRHRRDTVARARLAQFNQATTATTPTSDAAAITGAIVS
ncbi:hypothetical protein ACEXQB_001960 [Herbiconiux sp. P18]|uniref:hypothetical protein n=1 Tax=Herbiconiux liangxiaofengii TaxID=3342795 RepID=UPI0035B9EAA4